MTSVTQDGVRPEAGLPFALFLAGHLYIAMFEWWRWYMGHDPASTCFVVAVVALGGAWDNWRLLRGAMLGQRGLDITLTTISFLLHLSALPLLWIPLGDMFAMLIGYSFIGIPARMYGVMSCVRGLNELMIDVIGNYDVTYSGDLWRHTLKIEKRSMKLILPSMLLTGGAVILAFSCWVATGHRFSLIIQLLCVIGHVMASKDYEYGTHLSKCLEVIFLTDFVYLQCFISML